MGRVEAEDHCWHGRSHSLHLTLPPLAVMMFAPEHARLNVREKSKLARSTREAIPPPTVIEEVVPQVDGGRFAVKRVVGEDVAVTAACFAHGHERVACAVRYRGPGEGEWQEAQMEPIGNDQWSATFAVDRVGEWQYSVCCWIDHLGAWRDGFARRVDAEDLRLAARIGPT